jgi:hypothetical protein
MLSTKQSARQIERRKDEAAEGAVVSLGAQPARTAMAASALFTFAIARGVNRGWLPPSYAPIAQSGWRALEARGKRRTIIAVAVARELAGHCWALATM